MAKQKSRAGPKHAAPLRTFFRAVQSDSAGELSYNDTFNKRTKDSSRGPCLGFSLFAPNEVRELTVSFFWRGRDTVRNTVMGVA